MKQCQFQRYIYYCTSGAVLELFDRNRIRRIEHSFNIVSERRQDTIFKVFLVVVCQIFHVLVTVFHQISGHYPAILERLVPWTVNVFVAILDLELFAPNTSMPPMLGGCPSRKISKCLVSFGLLQNS